MALPDIKFDGTHDHPCNLILTHGVGQPMDSPFMDAFAQGLADLGFRVARFEFPYMAARRTDGVKRGPDRPNVLIQTWKDVVRSLGGGENIVIGGKSMGGRIASMVADEVGARGLVCLGYPFHAAGKPDKPRIAHLEKLKTPALIVQGTRDNMGKPEEVADYPLSTAIEVCWMEDGDHSFKPRKSSDRTEAQAWHEAVDTLAGFISKLNPGLELD